MESSSIISTSPEPIIRKIEFPPKILEELNSLFRSNCSELLKKLTVKRLLGSFKQCCVCQGLPEYEIVYPLGNATKIERYCTTCFNKREENDSFDPNEHFIIVDKIPPSEYDRLTNEYH